MQGYQIVDEPRPGVLSHLTVNPYWPLLGLMLGGAWLGWTWFAFNAFAIGSASKGRELAAMALGVAGSAGIVIGVAALAGAGLVEEWTIPYLLVAVVAWKLLVGYYVYFQQSRSFALHAYFGGVERSGMVVVAVAFFVRIRLVDAVSVPLLEWVLG